MDSKSKTPWIVKLTRILLFKQELRSDTINVNSCILFSSTTGTVFQKVLYYINFVKNNFKILLQRYLIP